MSSMLSAASANGATEGVPPQNLRASGAYVNEWMSSSNGSACENQPTSAGSSAFVHRGWIHMKPAPGPPHSHLTQLPSTTSASICGTETSSTPADCAMSTMQKMPRSRHSRAISGAGERTPVFECTCITSTAATSAVNACSHVPGSATSLVRGRMRASRPKREARSTTNPSDGNASSARSTTRRCCVASAGSSLESAEERFACGQYSLCVPPSSRARLIRKASTALSHIGHASPPASRQGSRYARSRATALFLGRHPTECVSAYGPPSGTKKRSRHPPTTLLADAVAHAPVSAAPGIRHLRTDVPELREEAMLHAGQQQIDRAALE